MTKYTHQRKKNKKTKHKSWGKSQRKLYRKTKTEQKKKPAEQIYVQESADPEATQILEVDHTETVKGSYKDPGKPVVIAIIIVSILIVLLSGIALRVCSSSKNDSDENTGLFDSMEEPVLSGLVQTDSGYYLYSDDGSGEFLRNTYAKVIMNDAEQISYFDEEGRMVTGSCEINGVTQTFDDNGMLLVDTEYLQNGVQEIIDEYDADISVYYKDLRTEETFSINEEEDFYPCSIIKIAALISTYNAIENGTLVYDEDIEEWITYMITVSDNTSFNNLIYNIGDGSGEEGAVITNELLQEMGCTRTEIVHSLSPGENEWRIGNSNISCALDIGLMLEELYKGEVVTPEACAEMIEILKSCEDDTKIQAGLPEDVEYAHKTGWDGDNYHDGGIVYVPQGDYILVVFSEGTYSSDMMERVSEFIYEYQSTLYPQEIATD